MSIPINAVIIYHNVKPGIPCSDGIAAAAVALKYLRENGFFEDQIKIIGDCYPASPEDEIFPVSNPGTILEHTHFYIVDFSYTQKTLRKVAEWASLTVYDHHPKTKLHIESLADLIEGKFDKDECGATLTWKNLFPDQPVPPILNYVRDRDLWRWELPNSDEITTGLYEWRTVLTDSGTSAKSGLMAALDFYITLLSKDEETIQKLLFPVGDRLVAPIRAKVKAIASRYELKMFNVRGIGIYSTAMVVLNPDGSEDPHTSKIGEWLYTNVPNIDFATIVASDRSVSFRSPRGGTNVRLIAEALGGGGHDEAAGCRPNSIEDYLLAP